MRLKRVFVWLALAPLFAPRIARADLLPADEVPIPRLVAFDGLEAFSDYALVIQNCYPRRSAEADAALPYCVITTSSPFLASGKLWVAKKSRLRLVNQQPAPPPEGGPDPAQLRTSPVLIERPDVNRVDAREFSGQKYGFGETGVDFGIRDHIAVKQRSELSAVTEVFRVQRLDAEGIELSPLRVVWTCRSGKRISLKSLSGPNQPGAPPSCQPSTPPAPSASAPPVPATQALPPAGSARPLLVMAGVLLVVGLLAFFFAGRKPKR